MHPVVLLHTDGVLVGFVSFYFAADGPSERKTASGAVNRSTPLDEPKLG